MFPRRRNVAERQENTKRIKLKTLSENTNVPRLAEEILEKCKLIHASKLTQVEQLLRELIDKQQGRQQRDRADYGNRLDLGKPTGERDQPLPAATCRQSGRLVSVG